MRVVVSEVVRRPAGEVFAFLADLEQSGPLVRELLEVRSLTPGPVGLGTRFRCAYRDPFGRHVADLEVAEFEPGRRLALRGKAGPFDYLGRDEVESVGQDARVTHTIEVPLRGPAALLERVFQPMARREAEASLSRLRTLLEGERE